MTLHTVRKIGPVLDLFTPEQPEWRLADIARALAMPKSSTHALVTSLAEVGLLSTGSRGRYRLSWNILSLSKRMRRGHDFRGIAGPTMRHLADEVCETVVIGVLDRREVIYVERAEGAHPVVRLAGVRVGSRAAAHATAVGKAILAHRPPEEAGALMAAGPLPRFTPRTITEPAALTDELDGVRARGIARSDRELHAEISCLAAPIRDRHGDVVAALCLALPAYRFADATGLAEPLRRAAAEITLRSGER